MSLASLLRELRDRHETLLTLNYGVGQLLFRWGLRPHLSGSTHQKYTVEEGTEYVQRVFGDYLRMIGESPAWLKDRHVLEVGPGDNYGVALQFAAHGALVHCLDRFAPLRDQEKNRAVYRRLGEIMEGDAAAAVTRFLLPDGDIRPGVINVHDSLAIEEAAAVLPRRRFDLIVSRAVLEHVHDLKRAWASMDTLLALEGHSVHKVDFRNHGFYGSIHPLAFLKLGDRLWDIISAPDPTLNRHRTGTYVSLCREFRYATTIYVTHWSMTDHELGLGSMPWPPAAEQVPERPEINRYRSRLNRKFRNIDVADLGVAGIFLAARRASSSHVSTRAANKSG